MEELAVKDCVVIITVPFFVEKGKTLCIIYTCGRLRKIGYSPRITVYILLYSNTLRLRTLFSISYSCIYHMIITIFNIPSRDNTA